jgi:hypothetical protein
MPLQFSANPATWSVHDTGSSGQRPDGLNYENIETIPNFNDFKALPAPQRLYFDAL